MIEEPSSVRSKSARRLSDTGDPRSLSTYFRLKRDIKIRNLISKVFATSGSVQILDLGGSVEYWNRLGLDFLRKHHAHIVVQNHIDSQLKSDDADTSIFTTMIGDACNLSDIGDNKFDIVHSNSVIEHVGNWNRMKSFSSEARRVGIYYYIQTPYFWFPIDPHYYRAPMIHWLPRQIQSRIITNFNICTVGKISNIDDAYRILDGTSLLDKAQFSILFPDAKISFETVIGIRKSLIAIREPASDIVD